MRMIRSGGQFMTYKLEIDPMHTFLHFIVTGQNSRANAESYINDILRECKARGYSRALIEERLEGPRLGFEDVFQIVSEGSKKARGMLSAVAYVDVNAEGDLMKFAETLAVNRSLPVAVFRRWRKPKIGCSMKTPAVPLKKARTSASNPMIS